MMNIFLSILKFDFLRCISKQTAALDLIIFVKKSNVIFLLIVDYNCFKLYERFVYLSKNWLLKNLLFDILLSSYYL